MEIYQKKNINGKRLNFKEIEYSNGRKHDKIKLNQAITFSKNCTGFKGNMTSNFFNKTGEIISAQIVTSSPP